LALVAVVVLLAGIKVLQIGTMIKSGQAFVPPPESVTSAKAQTANWSAATAAVGTLIAVHGVTLSSEVTGTVREILFDSGDTVKKGAVLVRMDTSVEQAQLASARADEDLAKITLTRARKLRETGANSPSDLDAAAARATQTTATVANLEATIAKKTIRAPYNGRIAIRQVELGQVLSPGTLVASLQSVTPIYVEFLLPQQVLANVKVGQRVRIQLDIFPGASWEGKVSVINPEVDVATRNVRLRATLNNPDGRLTPGMFASVEVLSDEQKPVTVIPATSVIYAPYGDSVFVVEEAKDAAGKPGTVAHQKFVRIGERRGDFIAVVSGLSPGETVVSSGAFKLRNGMAVKVNNSLAPAAELAPKPTEK
jgi:membrane fusion protein (multidrug efflux system)